MVRALLTRPLFPPLALAGSFLYGALLAAFVLVGESMGPWADTLLLYCFGLDPATRVYRLDALLAALLHPLGIAAMVALFFKEELVSFTKTAWGRAVGVIPPGIFLALLITVVATSQLSASNSPPDPTQLPRPIRQGTGAPDLRLTDQGGRLVSMAEFRGKVVLVTFFYVDCHASCPILLARGKALGTALAGTHRDGDLVFVGITLDPEHDTPGRLARHAAEWELGNDWHLLTGDPLAVRGLMDAYQVRAKRLDSGEIAHENLLALVDREGRQAFTFRGLRYPDRWLQESATLLLREPRG